MRFFQPLVPEIYFPEEKTSLDEKVVYSVSAGIIFVLAQVPLYGLVPDAALKMADPFPALRPFFAMEQATLLELGLLPIFTAGFAWQLAVGLRLVQVNLKKALERELLQTAQKLTAVALSVLTAAGLLVSGYYGNVLRDGSLWLQALVFVQTVGMSFFVTLVVEVIDKGYGFGLGVLCFAALHSATVLVRDVAGMEVVAAAPGAEPETYGVVSYLVKSCFTLSPAEIKKALVAIASRAVFPTVPLVLLVVAIGLVTVALQNVRLELPVRSTKARGTANVYPIRLLYTGALPVAFAYTVLANVQLVLHFAALLLWPHYPHVARWVAARDASGRLVSGALFYLSAPLSPLDAATLPIRVLVYAATVFSLAVLFAPVWASFSGSAARDVAAQFKQQSIIISGKRESSLVGELQRVIPTASSAGAAVLAAVALVGEVLGALGKAVSLVVGVCAAYAVLEDFMLEAQQSGGASQLMNSLAGYRQ